MVELDFEPKLQITINQSQLTEKQFKKGRPHGGRSLVTQREGT